MERGKGEEREKEGKIIGKIVIVERGRGKNKW